MDSNNENGGQMVERKERIRRVLGKLGAVLIHLAFALCIVMSLSTGIRMALWKTGIMPNMIDESMSRSVLVLPQEQLEEYDETVETLTKLTAEGLVESELLPSLCLSIAASCLIIALYRRKIRRPGLLWAVAILLVVLPSVDLSLTRHDQVTTLLSNSRFLMSTVDTTMLERYAGMPTNLSIIHDPSFAAVLPARAWVAFTTAYYIEEVNACVWRLSALCIGSALLVLSDMWRDRRAKPANPVSE